MDSLSDIRKEIFANDDAKRIIIKVNTKSLDSHDYYVASANSVISGIFPNWGTDSRFLLLAIDV